MTRKHFAFCAKSYNLHGDQMLKLVAERIKSSVRSSDVVARIGGDEFLVFMKYEEHIDKLVERIYRSVAGSFEDFEVSASIGVALAPVQGKTYEELFLHADQALYASKHAGKNQYNFYDDSMQTLLSTHPEWLPKNGKEDTKR